MCHKRLKLNKRQGLSSASHGAGEACADIFLQPEQVLFLFRSWKTSFARLRSTQVESYPIKCHVLMQVGRPDKLNYDRWHMIEMTQKQDPVLKIFGKHEGNHSLYDLHMLAHNKLTHKARMM